MFEVVQLTKANGIVLDTAHQLEIHNGMVQKFNSCRKGFDYCSP